MAERFAQGGRLLAFGRGACATDAQHVSVEFVHPVIVGKRALPALDLSSQFERWVPAIMQSQDIVMGFSPPAGDEAVWSVLDGAASRGAMTFALSGPRGTYAVEAPTSHLFIHQEIVEMLYHTLWETVHVFLERRELGRDVGQAGFLYPFLGRDVQPTDDAVSEVAHSIRMKVDQDAQLRDDMVRDHGEAIGLAALAIRDRLGCGGKLILFGNGGSATDANDWAMDSIDPPPGYRSTVPALSLSMEPAIVTALANDVGTEVIFSRQLIAHARPEDVAIGISTSGGSKNLIAALGEARRRGLLTIALLGYDGGEIVRHELADIALVVGCDYIPRIQEIHASIYHIIRELLEELDHD